MKQFFKFFTASCLGSIVAGGLVLLIVLGISAMSISKPELSNKTVLKISIDEPLPEKTGNIVSSSNPFEAPADALGLRHIKKLIAHAAKDDKIKGIFINDNAVPLGQATLTSLRASIEEFKASGKFVYSYADFMSQSSYFLASVADSVFLNPQGSVDIKGFGTMSPFFKEMLENTGVKMEVFYAGNFKSATEPFRRNDMSPYNKIQTREFLEDMLSVYQEKVATSRGMTVADVDNIMNNYSGRTAKRALEAKLIDKIAYIDEVEDIIRGKINIKNSKKIKYKTLSEYNNAVTLKKESSKNRIAVVYAEGSVNYGTVERGEINETTYRKYLNKIINDDKVKAVVLRVNSGGGSSLTSDIIWREIERVKAAGKPVIASFGDYAASGGYYIACGADTIVAEPNTLTGSIGVFTFFPNATELMNDKLGIHFDTIKTNPFAVGINNFYNLTEKESELIKESVDEVYDTFLTRVSKGRGMTKDAVNEVAQGRVWTGKKAKEIGLVDELGSLEDAIKIAAETSNLESYKVVEYPKIKETFIEQIAKGIAESEKDVAVQYFGVSFSEKEKNLIKEAKQISKLLLDSSPQSRLPFILKVD